jgi:hypothetical protein
MAGGKTRSSRPNGSTGSSSSGQADVGVSFAAALPLGEKLVAELGLADSVDTLGRWIVHHYASLIERAKTAKGPAKAEAERQAAAAILQLWTHRRDLPNGARPFEEYEPVLRLLRALDPEGPAYLRREVWDKVEPEKVPEQSRRWLQFAEGFDRAARMLIDECLIRAAKLAENQAADWVELATKDPAFGGPDIDIVITFSGLEDRRAERLQRNVEAIECRIHSLDTVAEACAIVRDDLVLKLNSARAEIGRSQD